MFAAPLALAACNSEPSAPTGQVVATVNGQEITATELEAELDGATAPTPEAQKNLQRYALENIINRTILAQAAEAEGLDKGPEFAVLEQKARQAALVQLLQRKIGGTLPQPSDDEIDNFITENPSLFSNRRTYVVDQIIVPQTSQRVLEALEPVKTMAEAQAVLNRMNVPGNKTVGVIDSLTIPPQAAQQIGALPPNEVFIIPSAQGIRINQVRTSQVDPITGDQARQVAGEMLSRQRSQSAMQNSLTEKIKAGRENVQYNDAFAPPKTPEGGAAPAGQPAAVPAE
ncbi:peptidyl-prolyl cis-trans isomerase [Qipengyuania sp.]|uniref:peptidyl-prolyl cis-trans isomerase n=1 Tax=Qipengyuania sp. TaxID=2004515 RepID=UPI0035C80FE2